MSQTHASSRADIDLKIKEAAAELGRPVGSIYNDVCRIRRALWHCIRKQLALEGHS